VGEGRLMILPFNLARDATDFSLNPMALPFWRRVAADLMGGRTSNATLTAGQTIGLRLPVRTDRDYRDALFSISYSRPDQPAATFKRAVDLQWDGLNPLVEGGIAAQSGYFAFESGNDTLGITAVGVPATESVATPPDSRAFAAQLSLAGLNGVYDLGSEDPAELGERLAGWDPLMLLVVLIILLMLLETAIARKA
jgi:hypothetical protein